MDLTDRGPGRFAVQTLPAQRPFLHGAKVAPRNPQRFTLAPGDMYGFAEIGANALNLSSNGADDEITRFGGGLFANWQGSRGGIDASAQYVDGHSNVAQVGMTLEGAPGAVFPARSPRTNGSAGLFTVSGHHELGHGWTLSGETRTLLASDEQAIAGSISISWQF